MHYDSLHERLDMGQHEHSEDDEMQSGQGFGETLIVTRQAAEAVG